MTEYGRPRLVDGIDNGSAEDAAREWNGAPEAELVEAIALRVVELLREGELARGGLVDAAALAEHLGVSRAFVYEHAEELGTRRLGDGRRARLRFDLERAERAYSCFKDRTSDEPAARTVTPIRRRRRAQRLGTEAPLLPIRPAKGGTR